VPVLIEPLAPEVRAELRDAVLRLRAAGGRRRPPPAVHVGRPDGTAATFEVPGDGLDHGLRCDVVATLLRRREPGSRPLTWLTRPGELSPHDLDAAWLSAAAAAHAEAGLCLTMVVVTRTGWWDPRSDVRQTWRRLRPRTGSSERRERATARQPADESVCSSS
jgi:hypothetical protein